jgi:selenocysteine lyase/cysteine desulfurase
LIGEEGEAVRVAEALREQGLFVPAIRYPTVARGRARLRVTLTANHTEEDVRQLLAALRIANPTTAGPPSTPVAAGREASGAVAENMS